MKTAKEFGEYLRELRRAANRSQQDVADVFGYTTAQFVSNWERGQSLPPEGALPKLAKIYGVPVRELIDRMAALKLAKLEDWRKTTIRAAERKGAG